MGGRPNRLPRPDRWFATLPWQYPDLAVEELERAVGAGAVGVMVLANIHGTTLVDPSLAPVWQAIDRRALPVLVHPTTPPGVHEMDLGRLRASIGFTFDTSLAIGRMVMEGFLDTYPNSSLSRPTAAAICPIWRAGWICFRAADTRGGEEDQRTAERASRPDLL